MRRLLYLDNLKVCLTVLVIFHHAGQAYGDGGGWAYTPSNPAQVMPWIWPFDIIPLPMEPAHYLQYVMMFVVGILASRFHWLDRMSKATGALSLFIGCLLAFGIYLRDGGEWNDFVTEWFGIYES